MKRLVLVGCILAVILLMIVPCIPAIEINQVLELNKSELMKELRNMDNEELMDFFQNFKNYYSNFKKDDGVNNPILLNILALLLFIIIWLITTIFY